MTRPEKQSKTDIDHFCMACVFFVDRCRLYLPDLNITCKLHLLESHFPDMMRTYERLGIFGEDPIEREHGIMNELNRTLACIKNPEQKARTINHRRNQMALEEMKKILSEVNSKTRRNFSITNQEKRTMQLEDNVKVKLENYMETVLNMVELYNPE